MSQKLLLGVIALATAATPLAGLQAENDKNDKSDGWAITVLAPRVEQVDTPNSLRTTRQLTASSLVYFDDLNLQTKAGREALYSRVKQAAQETCDWLDQIYPLDQPLTDDRECVRDAISNAQAQVDRALANYEG